MVKEINFGFKMELEAREKVRVEAQRKGITDSAVFRKALDFYLGLSDETRDGIENLAKTISTSPDQIVQAFVNDVIAESIAEEEVYEQSPGPGSKKFRDLMILATEKVESSVQGLKAEYVREKTAQRQKELEIDKRMGVQLLEHEENWLAQQHKRERIVAEQRAEYADARGKGPIKVKMKWESKNDELD